MSTGAIARLDHVSAVAAAARNNAEWCDALCRTHGLPGVFSPVAWTNPRRTPPFYPDAVTLSAAAGPGDVLGAIDTDSPGAGVKDSFTRLDLARDGFDVLFEAQWINRDAAPHAPGPERWGRIGDAPALVQWEEAWAGDDSPRGLFRSELLEEPNVVVMGLFRDGRVAAGAILYRSAAVVGVSNLFAASGDLAEAWTGCLAALSERAPGLPIVGYESGDELAAARRQGFSSTGALRVWVQSDSRSGSTGGSVT